MVNKFSQLRVSMSVDFWVQSSVKAEKMLGEMPLQKQHLACGLSQQTLAEALDVQQPVVTKMEKWIHPNKGKIWMAC